MTSAISFPRLLTLHQADFTEVARECGVGWCGEQGRCVSVPRSTIPIPLNCSSAKRYERIYKAHRIHSSGGHLEDPAAQR